MATIRRKFINEEVTGHDAVKTLESKCLSCKHYCKDGSDLDITTFTRGKISWHIDMNFCTLLGYHPRQVVFPRALNNPIGEVPDVIDCASYTQGDFKKRNQKPDILGRAMDEAEKFMFNKKEADEWFQGDESKGDLKMKESLNYFHDKLKQASKIPFDKFDVKKEEEIFISDITTSVIEFTNSGKLSKPSYVGKIINISIGHWKFFEDDDFTVNENEIQWHNPALLVGPHLKMNMTHELV